MSSDFFLKHLMMGKNRKHEVKFIKTFKKFRKKEIHQIKKNWCKDKLKIR